MLTVCYAAKGGSGTSVTTAMLALGAGDDALLVDLAGDAIDVLGVPDEQGPGLGDWLRSEAEPDALANLIIATGGACNLLPPGQAPPSISHHAPHEPTISDRLDAAWHWLATRPRATFVDAGTGEPPPSLRERADELLLVTRTCYLALRRAHASPVRPTGIIVVREPGRALHPRDAAATLDAPIVAEIPVDPAVARAVDAGLLSTTLPRTIQRAVGRMHT